MAHFTQISSKDEFASCIQAATGKTVLLAYWPEDALSNAVVAALRKQLPQSSYADYGIVDIYCFDMYSLPDLGTELEVNFVPMLMWYTDGVMDPIVWHQGVRVDGESVEKGVGRVVDRIKGGEIGEEEDSDEDWYNGKTTQKKSNVEQDSDDGW